MASEVSRFLLVFVIAYNAGMELVVNRCAAQLTGFLSLDCGSSLSTSYVDTLGIRWTPDTSYIEGGGTAKVSKPLGYDDTRYGSLRYFEGNQSRYCYEISGTSPAQIKSGSFYLIRATFWLGMDSNVYNMQDGGSGSLQFKLIIDSYVAGDVLISFPQASPVVVEVYMQAQSDRIAVCLSGAGASAGNSNAPFITSIEIRPLGDTMHPVDKIKSTQCGLHLLYRVDYGSSDTTRYDADGLDRIWTPEYQEPILSTDHIIDNGVKDLPPVKVLQTAYTTLSNWTTGFVLNFINLITATESYFYALYFAEIDPNVNASGLRVFEFQVDGILHDTIDVYNETGDKYSCLEHFDTFTAIYDYTVFYFKPTNSSKFLPFISGLELFQILASPMSSATYATDAAALKEIRSSFPTLASYKGDPCYPQGYEYSWVACNPQLSPRVTSILLSNYELQGEIPSGLNNLTSVTTIILSNNQLNGSIPDLSSLVNVEVLDLSNNSLSGEIPESLTKLPSLKRLYLQNNKLSGQVPGALNSLEVFNYAGNPSLCNSTKEACAVSVPPTASPSGNGGSAATGKGETKSKIGLVIGVIVGIIVIIAAIIVTICRIKKKKKEIQAHDDNKPSTIPRQVAPNTPNKGQENVGIAQVMKALNMAQAFTSHQLDVATNHFSTKLGGGGSGHVYQGALDGLLVAVKVIYEYSEQGVKEFTTELGLLSMVHHRNLVRLLGYCAEDNLMLVYEHMANGSLFDCLHGPHARATPLMWRTRLQILVDTANGLDYLHRGCNPQIIHRDIKSSNILISDDMEAKIGDLGISRLRNNASTQTATALRGTLGYVDPEYASTCNLTEKIDVYSFGVVILETISGRVPINKSNPVEEMSIVNWVRRLMDRGIMEDIMDGKMGEGYSTHAAWKVLDIACRCVEYKSIDRPSMEEVRDELTVAMRLELAIDLQSEPSTGGDYNNFYTNPSLRPR